MISEITVLREFIAYVAEEETDVVLYECVNIHLCIFEPVFYALFQSDFL
jgi:hypothetical protein